MVITRAHWQYDSIQHYRMTRVDSEGEKQSTDQAAVEIRIQVRAGRNGAGPQSGTYQEPPADVSWPRCVRNSSLPTLLYSSAGTG